MTAHTSQPADRPARHAARRRCAVCGISMVVPPGSSVVVCLSCAIHPSQFPTPSQRHPELHFTTLFGTRPAPLPQFQPTPPPQFPPPQFPPPQFPPPQFPPIPQPAPPVPPTPQPVPPRARRTPSHTRQVRPSGRHAATLARVSDAALDLLADAGPAGLTVAQVSAQLPRRDKAWTLRALLALRTEGLVTGPAANIWRTVGNPR